MSDSIAFDTLKPTLEAYAEGDTRQPDMPVEVAVQEGELMHTLAVTDAQTLEAAGLGHETFDNLSLAVGALRYSQAQWLASLGELRDATKTWREQQAVARSLRQELLSALAFATQNVPNATKAIHRLRSGQSDAHVLQDLVALSELGKKYATYLQAIHFDMAKLDLAANLAETGSPLFAKAQLDTGISDTKSLRDRAFTFLRRTMAQILGAAEYAFRKNQARLNLYYSQYRRLRAKSSTGSNGSSNANGSAQESVQPGTPEVAK